jgi:hypothetical protein
MPKEPTKGREWAEAAGGNVKRQFVVSPEHDKALADEAFRRAASRGSRKPDASEVLREILDDWMKRRRKK